MHENEKNKKDGAETQELWDNYKGATHTMGTHEGE